MSNDLSGLRIVVTAGGTAEPIDPVRVITNRSSGKMGFAFAAAARDRGALVTLVSAAGRGSVEDVAYVPVETVESMRAALLELGPQTDILIMAAAVSDFRVSVPASEKIKKRARMVLELESIPDFMRRRATPATPTSSAKPSTAASAKPHPETGTPSVPAPPDREAIPGVDPSDAGLPPQNPRGQPSISGVNPER